MHGRCIGEKMQSYFIKSVLFALATLSSVTSFADNTFEPVVVTASRYSESLQDSLSSSTVITSKEIEASSASSLEEIFNTVAGLDIKPSGVFGKNTSIFMRGTNSSHTLTMIDGVKIYSATSGGAAYQHIPLNQIDRIEIVRGPRSGLYGSEAIGGVIQIFTKKGQLEPEASFTIEQGSYNTSEINAGFSGRNGKFSYSLNANQLDTDGIDSIVHTTTNDDDSYNNKSLSSSLSYDYAKDITLSISVLDAQGITLYDNCYDVDFDWIANPTGNPYTDNCYADFQQQTVSTKASYTPDGIWDASLIIGYSKDFSDNFWNDDANNTFQTEYQNISFQNNFQLTEDQLVIAGIDSTDDKVSATPYDSTKSRENLGVFLSWNGKVGKIKTSLNLRNDDNEQFGSHSTGTVSAGMDISKQSNLFVSFGSAFKAPSFNELYFPFYGSEDLVPEESESFEFGYKASTDNVKTDISIFRTTVDNLINYDSALGTANNISKAEIEGIEASLGTTINKWKVDFSAAFIEPLNKDTAYLNNILPARTKHKTNIKLSRNFGKTDLNLSVLNQGSRFTDANNDQKLDGYTTLDIKLGHKLNKNMTVNAKLNNAFDEEYAINANSSSIYNTMGRSVFISLNYKM